MSVTISGSGQIVKQAVNTNSTSASNYFSTSSSSMVSTGLSVTITPSSSSSKILVLFGGEGGSSNFSMALSLFRNGTNLSNGSSGANYIVVTQGGYQGSVGFSWMDSPATTSAVTYTVYIATNGTAYLGRVNQLTGSNEGSGLSLTALEISGA